MEISPASISGQTAAETAEKALVELVKVRQMEVERLERELDAVRAHCAFLFKSFSVPTFPEGYDPDTANFRDTPDVSKDMRINGALTPCYGNANFPPSDPRVQEMVGSLMAPGEKLVGVADGNMSEDGGRRDHIDAEKSKKKGRRKDLSASCIAAAASPSSTNSPQSPPRHLKPVSLPSLSGKNEDAMSNEAIKLDKTAMKSAAQIIRIPETPSSSESLSLPVDSTDLKDLISLNDVDLLKEAIRRERPGAKSPRKSPAKCVGNSTSSGNRIVEKLPVKVESICSSSGSSSEESSSESEVSSSETEESTADSDSEEVRSQQPSSSSASDRSNQQRPGPSKFRRILSPKMTWQPKIKVASSSSGSGESSSSSDEDLGRDRWHTPILRPSSGRVRAAAVPRAVSPILPAPDDSPEDLFDWSILGLQGPWMPVATDEITPETSEQKDQFSVPLKFPSLAAYIAVFQKLIGDEARAILRSEWEQYTVEQETKNNAAREAPMDYSHSKDSRGLSSVWQLRSMVQATGDAFHHIEAEWVEGPKLHLVAGEFLCMVVPNTREVKAVAIVNFHERSTAILLRTRTPWDSSLGKCILLRLCNMVTLRRMFLAVSTLSKISSPLRQQILDPQSLKNSKPPFTPEDALDADSKLNLSYEALRSFSVRKILNSRQLLTISSLVRLGQGFQLVQGPPGTGKTSTIVGMVSTLLIEEPGVRILVCTPSNAALDEVAARLMQRMLDKEGKTYSAMDGTVVRFGSKDAMHPLVQSISLDRLALRLSTSSKRLRSWADILNGACIVCATLSGCGNTLFDELDNKFDVVIIDEAAQAVEAEVLIALSRVRGRCVMVGDPQQLPATVFQRPGAAFGRSLFERFQEGGVHVHLLTTQYRMHPSICLYPSQQFYGGLLKDSRRSINMLSIYGSEVCERGITVRGCKFKLGHYCFMDVGWGIEREELIGHSRANFEEALVVCNVVEGVVKGLLSGLKPNVGVITPYIAQRGVIEDQLESRGIDSTACEVNTVDGFQGREKDVIVLSCVRAMADRGLGFVSDERRMNVALTRAKFSLIIIGHAETLQKWSPSWDSLIEDAQKRGCYQVLTDNKSQDPVERDWVQRHTSRKNLYGTVEDETGRKSGSSKRKSLNGMLVNTIEEPQKGDKDGGFTSSRKGNSNKLVEAKNVAFARRDVDDDNLSTKMKNLNRRAGDDETLSTGKQYLKQRTGADDTAKRKSESLAKNDHGCKKSTSLAVENTSKAFPAKKNLEVVEDPLESPTVRKKKKLKVSERILDPPVPCNNKNKMQPSLSDPPISMKTKVEVNLNPTEPLATEKGKNVKEGGLELPTEKKKKKTKKKKTTEAEESAPVLQKNKKSTESVELPVRRKRKLKEDLVGFTESVPKPLSLENEVGVERLGETPSNKKEKEVIVYEVTSRAHGGGHTRWISPDSKDAGKARISVETPADPTPRNGLNWRSATAQEQLRGWFPKVPGEDSEHSRHVRQSIQVCNQSVLPSRPTGLKIDFAVGKEQTVAVKLPHWGNSYGDAGATHHRPHPAGVLDTRTNSNCNLLARPNDYLGLQTDTGSSSFQQEPRNQLAKPNATLTQSHRNPNFRESSGRPHSKLAYRRTDWETQQSDSEV